LFYGIERLNQLDGINMTLKKGKKGKLAVIPKQKAEVIAQRPSELWSDMDQLFNRFRTNVDDLFWGPRANLMTVPEYRIPLMDIVDFGDKYEMHVEMPGIKKEDICIEVTPTMVEISAEHKEKSEETRKNWLRQERSNIDFYRSFQVPETLKTGKVEAELKDGILKVSLPKADPKPKYETTKVKIK
jgi:HSP20 family protein